MLVIFTIGAFMEANVRKALMFGAATVFAGALAAMSAQSRPVHVEYGDCYIDWDGRSNPEVCQ